MLAIYRLVIDLLGTVIMQIGSCTLCFCWLSWITWTSRLAWQLRLYIPIGYGGWWINSILFLLPGTCWPFGNIYNIYCNISVYDGSSMLYTSDILHTHYSSVWRAIKFYHFGFIFNVLYCAHFISWIVCLCIIRIYMPSWTKLFKRKKIWRNRCRTM